MGDRDYYQLRYEKHQAKKKESLQSTWGTEDYKKYVNEERALFFDMVLGRRSQRNFNSRSIDTNDLSYLKNVINRSPSSCDRKGVRVHEVTERDEKELLGGLLVGGIGWIHRASLILLFWGAKRAYKAPGEFLYMPYLDTGVIVGNLYLACEVLNIGCCFVNPNIRDMNKEFFRNTFGFGEDIFCGAMALGNFDRKAL